MHIIIDGFVNLYEIIVLQISALNKLFLINQMYLFIYLNALEISTKKEYNVYLQVMSLYLQVHFLKHNIYKYKKYTII